jgi:hypothetical protein
MLALIERLRQLPGERRAWGLTSHYQLCLLAEDDWKTPRLVTIGALDHWNFFIEYLMPERLAPWPGARVTGQAESEDDAIRMILTAMARSEGWTGKG